VGGDHGRIDRGGLTSLDTVGEREGLLALYDRGRAHVNITSSSASCRSSGA
jgi:hypothetical protein